MPIKTLLLSVNANHGLDCNAWEGEKSFRMEGHRFPGSVLSCKAQGSPGELKATKLPISLVCTGLCD